MLERAIDHVAFEEEVDRGAVVVDVLVDQREAEAPLSRSMPSRLSYSAAW